MRLISQVKPVMSLLSSIRHGFTQNKYQSRANLSTVLPRLTHSDQYIHLLCLPLFFGLL